MAALDDVLHQMMAAGMPPLPQDFPRLGKVIRFGPKKRAWYRLREYTTRTGVRHPLRVDFFSDILDDIRGEIPDDSKPLGRFMRCRVADSHARRQAGEPEQPIMAGIQSEIHHVEVSFG